MPAVTYELIHVCKQTGARLGKVILLMEVLIPAFMPVGTQATVKACHLTS